MNIIFLVFAIILKYLLKNLKKYSNIHIMKRISFILILLLQLSLPGITSEDFLAKNTVKTGETNIFVYHLSDDSIKTEGDKSVAPSENSVVTNNATDDITVDTSLDTPLTEDEEWEIPPLEDYDAIEISDYDLYDMYGDVLKGGIEYNDEEVISLEDIDFQYEIFNIKKPLKLKEKISKGIKSSNTNILSENQYSKFNSMPEYSITPISLKDTHTIGGFSAGTSYGQWIYSGELEQASGIFSGYQYKNLYLQASYVKVINSTNNDYNSNFYFSPEYKVNQYLTIKPRFSTDIDTKKKRAEIAVAINPFGLKDPDRLSIELGAVEVLDENNEFLKNQFRFSTNFKL